MGNDHDGERRSHLAERVTVNLTVRASSALAELMSLTGDSKTDSINRALSVYAYLERVYQGGGMILVQDDPEVEPKRLVIL